MHFSHIPYRLLKSQLGDECPYLSIDTFCATVAREAVAAGADLVNDISGGKQDPEMLKTVGNYSSF